MLKLKMWAAINEKHSTMQVAAAKRNAVIVIEHRTNTREKSTADISINLDKEDQ